MTKLNTVTKTMLVTATDNAREKDNRNTPSYLAHYNMHTPPFSTHVENEMYYPDPTHAQRLDMLLHLTQYGNEVLLVTAPPGGGKTLLMHQYLARAHISWRMCQFAANVTMAEEQLIKHINRGFNFAEEHLSKDAALANLTRRLDALLVTCQTVIIVIDNAHALSTDCLRLLMDLAALKNNDNKAVLKVVLFCNPQIKIKLASPELEQKRVVPHRKIDLPPMNELQTGNLVKHRVGVAGMLSEAVFSEATIKKIYRMAKGIPEATCEIAHQILFESTPIKRRKKFSISEVLHRQPKSLASVAAVIAIVVVLFGLLIFEGDINSLYGKPSKTESESTVEKLLDIPVAPSQNKTTIASSRSNSASLRPNFSGRLADDTDLATFAKPELKSRRIKSTSAVVEAQDLVAGNGKEKTRKPSSQSTSPTLTSANVVINENNFNITITHQENWLLNQNPNYYTLQLLAGYQSSTINKFINIHQLDDQDIAYYLSANKGKKWHSLVFGVYPSRQRAQQAIDQLPTELQQVKPWIRKIEKIQTEISNHPG